MQGERGRLGRRQLGQVTDDAAEAHRLLVQGGELVRIGRHQPVAQLLEAGLQSGERGAQLVRDVRRHLPASVLGAHDGRLPSRRRLARARRARRGPRRPRPTRARPDRPRRRSAPPPRVARAAGRSAGRRTRRRGSPPGSRTTAAIRIHVQATVWRVDGPWDAPKPRRTEPTTSPSTTTSAVMPPRPIAPMPPMPPSSPAGDEATTAPTHRARPPGLRPTWPPAGWCTGRRPPSRPRRRRRSPLRSPPPRRPPAAARPPPP